MLLDTRVRQIYPSAFIRCWMKAQCLHLHHWAGLVTRVTYVLSGKVAFKKKEWQSMPMKWTEYLCSFQNLSVVILTSYVRVVEGKGFRGMIIYYEGGTFMDEIGALLKGTSGRALGSSFC